MITVLIPNYNGRDHLQKCLASLAASQLQAFKLIVVDNGSSDDSQAVFDAGAIPDKKWIQLEENYGFAKAVNLGVAAVETPYTFLLNNDTEVMPDTLSILQQTFADSTLEHLVAVQPLMLQMDQPRLVDNAGDSLSWYGIATKRHHGEEHKLIEEKQGIFSPSGGACLYDTFFLKTQKFDERFGSYLEDVDLGLRGRLLGYHYMLEPAAVVYHKGHGSRMPRKMYVRNMTRNTLLLLRNIPSDLRVKYLLKVIYGQVHRFLAYGRPRQSLLGYSDYLKLMSGQGSGGSLLQQKISLQLDDIEAIITNDFPEPGFFQVLADFFYNLLLRPFMNSKDD